MKIVVICAMESEARHLRAHLVDVREERLAHLRCSVGTLGEHTVNLVDSSIGMINAAIAATLACRELAPDVVLNYGCSGAHRKDILPGDVIIGSKLIDPASHVILPDGDVRPSGFRFQIGDKTVLSSDLRTDADLRAAAISAARELELPAWPGNDKSPSIHVGPIASADIWTQHQETIRALHARFSTLCEDMEAVAIGHVAATFNVPFLTVKDISNNELLAHSDMDAEDDPLGNPLGHVNAELGGRAALVVEALIRSLTGD